MVSSTGTFVSCKDYDDDIDAINKELTDIKSQLAALQTEVDGGNWVTELVDVEGGFKVTFSNGTTYNIVNGKDGAQGEPGTPGKDGNGTICLLYTAYLRSRLQNHLANNHAPQNYAAEWHHTHNGG